MTRTTTVFRALILGSILLGIGGAALDLGIPGLVPADVWDAYLADESSPFGEVGMYAAMSLGVLLLLIGLVGAIGLWTLRRWARTLSIWVSLLSVLLYPAMGVVVTSGWAETLLETSTMSWGAVLAMAYFSELAVHFEAPNPVRSTSSADG